MTRTETRHRVPPTRGQGEWEDGKEEGKRRKDSERRVCSGPRRKEGKEGTTTTTTPVVNEILYFLRSVFDSTTSNKIILVHSVTVWTPPCVFKVYQFTKGSTGRVGSRGGVTFPCKTTEVPRSLISLLTMTVHINYRT